MRECERPSAPCCVSALVVEWRTCELPIEAVRGMSDILPGEIEHWQRIEAVAREVFETYGYAEIRCPMLEKTDLFARGIGETTQLVEKEMYSFQDRKGSSITLRPEGTASVVRAFIQHKLYKKEKLSKFYYMGAMFRYERPQKGRSRQFHQIGAEVIGSAHPMVDAEAMSMLLVFLARIGVPDTVLHLNSVGCDQCRDPYREILTDYLKGQCGELCDDCIKRIELNPLRSLDCKNPKCRPMIESAPSILEHLCEACEENFEEVKGHLDDLGTEYHVDRYIVRGLDYYSRVAFEVTAGALGAQDAVGGGGRYDKLVEELGGPPVPCFGFALGQERLALSIAEQPCEDGRGPFVFFAFLGEEALKSTFRWANALRAKGIRAEILYESGSLKSQMRRANGMDARFVVIVGETELDAGKVTLRDMKCKDQSEISTHALVDRIALRYAEANGER